jgi:hypothetical protein
MEAQTRTNWLGLADCWRPLTSGGAAARCFFFKGVGVGIHNRRARKSTKIISPPPLLFESPVYKGGLSWRKGRSSITVCP